MRTVKKGLTFLRALGVLYGVACGDALGAPFEFWPSYLMSTRCPPDFGSPQRMLGSCTDDTGMTLAVARGLLEGGPDRLEECVGRAFIYWLSGSPRGVGFACATSIQNARAHLEHPQASWDNASCAHVWREAAKIAEIQAGHTTDGNGALMRCSFCGLYAKSMSQAMELAMRQAELTHTGAAQKDACAWYAATIWALSRSSDPWATWSQRRACLSPWFAPVGYPADPDGTAISTMRAVVHMVDAAQEIDQKHTCAWLNSPRSITRNILEATVMLGGDTDTVASLVGGLLGAIYGVDAIPRGWRHALDPSIRGRILQVTRELFKS